MKAFVPYVVTEIDDNLMIDRMHIDNRTGRLTNRRIVIRDGMRRDKPFFLRMYNANEIEEMLLKAGLELVKIFGGWDGATISPETRRMVIIAKKQ